MRRSHAVTGSPKGPAAAPAIVAVVLAAGFVLAGPGALAAPVRTSAVAPPAGSDTTPAVPGQLLVGFHPAIDPATREALDRQVGATVLRRMDLLGAELVALQPGGLGIDEAEQAYAASGAVRFSQPNYVRRATGVTPNDPSFSQPTSQLYGQQWGLRNTGQAVNVPGMSPFSGTPGADVHASEPGGAPDAWELTTGSSRMVVAVVDGGIQIDHPDLAPNIWTNPGEIPGNRIDDDRNGLVDDVHGWDFAAGDPYVSSSDPSPGNRSDGCVPATPPGPEASYDDHGTHVAGVVGAVGDNGIGIAGVAWKVKILPVKFLACDEGDDAAAVAAIEYAIRMGADVINASWGGAGTGPGGGKPLALRDAIAAADRAGIPVVVAAGNGGSDLRGDDLSTHKDYPASFDLPNEIVVASTDGNDRLSRFSNFGGPTALSAPGERIVSTLTGSAYGFEDGTSMAAPFVSGAAALLLSQTPGMTPEEVKGTLLATVDKVPALASPVTSSGGRLNIAAALRHPAGTGATSSVTGPGSPGPVVQTPAATSYRLVAADGGVFAFGDAPYEGSTGNVNLNRPIVAMAPTPSGQGYWMAASDGGIFAFGDAPFKGSAGNVKLARPIVGMARTTSAQGYWLVASDGGIFAFGDAPFKGSTGAIALTRPIVGMAPTPSGQGYWLVASDGGIFAFGDAAFLGSTGALRLSRPIVAMAPTPTGRGYWLVASDGGIFAFGDAPFRGSAGALHLGQPVVGMAPGA